DDLNLVKMRQGQHESLHAYVSRWECTLFEAGLQHFSDHVGRPAQRVQNTTGPRRVASHVSRPEREVSGSGAGRIWRCCFMILRTASRKCIYVQKLTTDVICLERNTHTRWARQNDSNTLRR
ncbi:hypothetical protein E4U17_004365, partial [Claviceps sp. LM77 group G4]